MTFDFGTLIAHLAKTRNLGAGTIIGSGTVSNRDADGGPGKPVDRGGRAIPASPRSARSRRSSTASAATPFLKPGDRCGSGWTTNTGHSIFGTIEQEVVAG